MTTQAGFNGPRHAGPQISPGEENVTIVNTDGMFKSMLGGSVSPSVRVTCA
jgi:hypothetical protein